MVVGQNASDEIGVSLGLVPGEMVEVRTREEILASLDADGNLDGMPFMPEMLEFCGARFSVKARADKTCDTVNQTGGRRLHNTVHLGDLRCNGAAHGGCQAECLLFWKEAWLKRVHRPSLHARLLKVVPVAGETKPDTVPGCSEDQLRARVRPAGEDAADGEGAYRCQATELYNASRLLHWWDPRQYLRDLVTRNAGPLRMFRALLFVGYRTLTLPGVGYGLLTGLYDRFQALRDGTPWPLRSGICEQGTPRETLDLEPGEEVEVKSYPEILATLDRRNKNRGLYFDVEMVQYCGRRFRVGARVSKILNEKTGVMMHFPNECIILKHVDCSGDYSPKRLFCPRAIHHYWREAWLRRSS